MTITPVAALPTVAINDVTVTALAGGPTNVVFTVILSAPSTQAVSVNFATADGTARAGADYVATNGTLTFSPGLTTQVIPVSVPGHAATNSVDESFFVNLSGAAGATLARGQGTGTIHETVTLPPSIVLLTPANQSTFCYNSNSSPAILLRASVNDSSNPPSSIDFYAGSALLGSVTSPSNTFEWDGALTGDYSLTATVGFADGTTLTSAPALVAVSDVCADVAIVRNYADPEIGLLQSNLFVQMGLSSQVFDQAGLTPAELQGYELVIWDELGGQTNGPTDNTVRVLQSVFTNGIPLYLIGDNLASDTTQLSGAQSTQWIQLSGLAPATSQGGDGSVDVSSMVPRDPILNGQFGNVSNFAYASNVELATPASTNAGVLGYSGTSALLLANPATDVYAPGQTRVVTQDFRVASGTDSDSLVQRYTLFMNSVCWLLGVTNCSLVGLGLDPTGSIDSAAVGQSLTYEWQVSKSGECDGIGATATSVLPSGTQFVSAQSDSGTWVYDTHLAAVIFQLGLLPSGSAPNLSITVIPLQPGMITNLAEVHINGLFTNAAEPVVTQVIGPSALSLLWSGGKNYLLQLFGNAGQTYDLQTSPDLLQWTDWTNVSGPFWMTPLSDPSLTNFNRRFYRIGK